MYRLSDYYLIQNSIGKRFGIYIGKHLLVSYKVFYCEIILYESKIAPTNMYVFKVIIVLINTLA